MKRTYKPKNGQATLEYIVLAIFLLGALLVIQKYLAQAIAGRWKNVGDSFAHGRVFDAKKTLECVYDPVYNDRWYNAACYEELGCGDPCLSIAVLDNPADCQACIGQCFSSFCDD